MSHERLRWMLGQQQGSIGATAPPTMLRGNDGPKGTIRMLRTTAKLFAMSARERIISRAHTGASVLPGRGRGQWPLVIGRLAARSRSALASTVCSVRHLARLSYGTPRPASDRRWGREPRGGRAHPLLRGMRGAAHSNRARPSSVAYCRAIAMRRASSGATRWSTLSAAAAIAICTPFMRPVKALPRATRQHLRARQRCSAAFQPRQGLS